MNCFYCGIVLTEPPRTGPGKRYPKGFRFAPTMHTRDHVVAKMHGGRYSVPACHKCNLDKGVLSLDEFRVIMGMRVNYEDWWHGSYVFPGEAAPSEVPSCNSTTSKTPSLG